MNKTLSSTTPALRNPQNVTESVVYAVADAEGVSPLDLRPLAREIDSEALNALVRDGGNDVTVEFTYHGYRVRVHDGERVTVNDCDE